MVLEKMDEVFAPFAQRDLSGVEYGVRERVEPLAASRGEAFVGLYPVFPLPVSLDAGAPAVRACLYGDGVDEPYLRRACLGMLLDVPSHEVLLEEKPGRAAQKDGLRVDSVLSHVFAVSASSEAGAGKRRNLRVQRRAPGSGETSDGIRLRTSSKSAWSGSGNIMNQRRGLFKKPACALFAF